MTITQDTQSQGAGIESTLFDKYQDEFVEK